MDDIIGIKISREKLTSERREDKNITFHDEKSNITVVVLKEKKRQKITEEEEKLNSKVEKERVEQVKYKEKHLM